MDRIEADRAGSDRRGWDLISSRDGVRCDATDLVGPEPTSSQSDQLRSMASLTLPRARDSRRFKLALLGSHPTNASMRSTSAPLRHFCSAASLLPPPSVPPSLHSPVPQRGHALLRLQAVLSPVSKIQSLNLGFNQLGKADDSLFSSLCASLEMNSSLVELDLGSNSLRPAAWPTLCAALSLQRRVEWLSLSHTAPTLEGAPPLINMGLGRDQGHSGSMRNAPQMHLMCL